MEGFRHAPPHPSSPTSAAHDGGGVDDGQEDQGRDGYFDPLDETDPRASLDDDLAMYVSDLVLGERVVVQVRNGGAGLFVRPFYSLNGSAPTYLGYGVYVNLSPPIENLPDCGLDTFGDGERMGPRVPATAPLGVPVWIQGVEANLSGAGGFSFRVTGLIRKWTVQ